MDQVWLSLLLVLPSPGRNVWSFVGARRRFTVFVLFRFLSRVARVAFRFVACRFLFVCFFFVFQVVEDGYEFFARRHLVTLFSAPNYCGEFDNAGAMMSVDDTLMCSFQARNKIVVAFRV